MTEFENALIKYLAETDVDEANIDDVYELLNDYGLIGYDEDEEMYLLTYEE